MDRRKLAMLPRDRDTSGTVALWAGILAVLVFAALGASNAFAAEAPNGEATKDVTIQAPTQNTDGSALTDLATLRLWWAQTMGEWVAERTLDIPFTTAGGTHTETATVNVVGNIGDTVTVFYTATAIDEHGNESTFATAISETFLIVDTTVPMPPTIMFSVEVTRTCTTPDGATCGLVPVG